MKKTEQGTETIVPVEEVMKTSEKGEFTFIARDIKRDGCIVNIACHGTNVDIRKFRDLIWDLTFFARDY